ncbi:MAG: hypothetical protein ABSG30_04045 [Steroidobacteraceae bacterium]|jgi:hypothetical protein
MNARTVPAGQAKAVAAAPRFDAKFIEEHKLIERYLEGKLPLRGAVDLENWCRAHPEYLDKLNLSERAQASLKLLEASGHPVDLREPQQPWWKSPYLLIGLAAATLLSLAATWLLVGKYDRLRGELEDVQLRAKQGPLVQPAVRTERHISPDHAPGLNAARIAVNTAAPQLMDLYLDMTYTQKLNLFRITVDKQDQGRALILNNLLKDSNNDLRMTFNTTGLSAGIYTVRIEAIPPRGDPIPDGWLLLEVR